MQSRLSQRKRAARLMAHPRFRAAYDFLVLRQVASDEHAEDVAFWRDAQQLSGEDLTHRVAMAQESGDEGELATRRRRRRRRRPAGHVE